MVSNVYLGRKAEAFARRILEAQGYQLAAKARGAPVWKRGRVVANDGPTDLCGSSVDLILHKKGRRWLCVQVCHLGGESPRRAKLRAVDWDDAHDEVILLAFERDYNSFRAYRREDDYMERGWRLGQGDMELPWDAKARQVTLPDG